MRSAVCLYGLSTGKNDKGDPVSYGRAYDYLKKNILDLQDVDIFIHTWTDNESVVHDVSSLYLPVKAKFEKQRMFDGEGITKLHYTKSRWYSHKEVLKLKKQYEEEEGMEYDFVLITRFDNCFLTPLVFSEYSSEYFYSSNWEKPHSDLGFLDYWFFSNSKTMDMSSSLFDEIDNYLEEGHELSSHSLAKTHAKRLNFKLKTTKREYEDFGIERMLPNA